MLERVFILPRGEGNTRIGAAMIVGPDHAITCAHVLREGKYPPTISKDKTFIRIEIDGQECNAELLSSPWINDSGNDFPMDEDLPLADDVTVLKIPAKKGRRPKLRKRRRIEKGVFSAFGATDLHPNGVSTLITLANIEMRGVVQLDWDGAATPIDHGFSGGAVYDEDDYAVGIIVSRWFPDEGDRHSNPLAYMIPIETVATRVKDAEKGFELQIESALFVDYPAAKELLEWSWSRLRRRTIAGAKSPDLFELGILAWKAPDEDWTKAITEIDQLHEGGKNLSAFDRLSVTDLLEKERQFLYLRSPGGSGKSFFLYHCVVSAVHIDVVPFFIDVRGLARFTPAQIEVKFGGNFPASLDNLINECGIHSGGEKFRIANERGYRALLLVDGLNETTSGFEQIIRSLQATPGNYNKVSILVADRLAVRPEYPRGFQLATVEPVSDELITRVLDQRFVSAEASRILKLPFFLNLYLQSSNTLERGNRATLILEFVRRSLGGHDSVKDQAADSQVDMLSGVAFKWYKDYETTVIGGSQLQKLLPQKMALSVEMLVSSGLMARRSGKSVRADSRFEFQHQLIQDYLAARHFVRKKLKWSAENFKALTLNRQSVDVLIFAREIVEETGGVPRSEDFIIAVYNWDYSSAFACLQLKNQDSNDRPIGVMLSALLAEKLFEPFLHSRQTAEKHLVSLTNNLVLQTLPTSIDDLVDHVAGLKPGSGTAMFGTWLALYNTTAGNVDFKVLKFLVAENPLMGWTAANVIRRLKLTKSGATGLKRALTRAGRELSSAKANPVRWRVYHALGTHYSDESIETLWKAVWNSKEHEDTRYGAARSLVELAVHAPSEEEGADILDRISTRLLQLSSSIGISKLKSTKKVVAGITAFRKCAILKEKKSAEPKFWADHYLRILLNGASLFQKINQKEAQLWEDQKARFLAEDRLG
jgi:hypothetical protein